MFKRRILLMAAAISASFASWGQDYPVKPIRLILPLGAGTATDAITRIIAEPLGKALGQPIVIENKPGADGAIGASEVARAQPDGYTLLLGTATPLSAGPHLNKKLAYSALTDFTPLALFGTYTMVMSVNSNLPVKTLPEFIAHARSRPGKVNYATGSGSGIVLSAAFNSMAGLTMVQVPYKSEPQGMTDVAAGNVDFIITGYSVALPLAQAGKIRVLATTTTRSAEMPDVATLGEQGVPPMPVTSWAGLFGPAKMPKALVDRLNREWNAVLERPEVREALAKKGFDARTSSASEFTEYFKGQYDNWGKAIKTAGIEGK